MVSGGGRKMMPYTKKPNTYIERAYKTDHVPGRYKGVSSYDKLITKNANRSHKKAYRQQLKRELENEIKDLQG